MGWGRVHGVEEGRLEGAGVAEAVAAVGAAEARVLELVGALEGERRQAAAAAPLVGAAADGAGAGGEGARVLDAAEARVRELEGALEGERRRAAAEATEAMQAALLAQSEEHAGEQASVVAAAKRVEIVGELGCLARGSL